MKIANARIEEGRHKYLVNIFCAHFQTSLHFILFYAQNNVKSPHVIRIFFYNKEVRSHFVMVWFVVVRKVKLRKFMDATKSGLLLGAYNGGW